MKRLILALLAAVIMATAAAQTYNMEVSLKNGNKITVAADSVSEVRFVKVTTSPEDVFNILTEEYIPDPVLRDSIRSQVAKGAETLTNIEAAKYTGILSLRGIEKSLKGLEFFSGITQLLLSYSQIETFDAVPFKDLTYLYLENNSKMTSVNLAGLEKLEELQLNYCRALENFDMTKLPSSIKVLSIKSLKLTSIDISSMPLLERLSCEQNSITSIAITNNTVIKSISCGSNKLESLSVAGCTNLQRLTAGSNNSLASVDISGCQSLETLALMNTRISEIDVQPIRNSLKILTLSQCPISSIDLNGCYKLEQLSLNGTQVNGDISFPSCVNLQRFRIENTNVKTLDLSHNPQLFEIHCYDVPNIESVTLADNLTELYQLNIWAAPKLKSLTWGRTYKLGYANIYNTGLPRLDISKVNHDMGGMSLKNPFMTEIKVWEGFDIANPPTNIKKNEETKFVYEFTQE